MTATLPEQQPAGQVVVRRPGVYDLPEEQYHADPVPGGSLSSTGARRILDCPARYHAAPQETSRALELGTAAHKVVLGVGPELEPIDYADWRTKAAKQAVAEARERGAIPLKRGEYEHLMGMAEALKRHPVAGPIFTEQAGKPEQSLFWQDPDTRVVCRARLDHLPHPVKGQRLIVADYKSTASAAPQKIARSVAEYGYHIQDAWYRDGVRALAPQLGVDPDDVAFVFVFQERTPPYLVTVVELDAMAVKAGAVLAEKARRVYAECRRTGRWPGYHDHDVLTVALPAWQERAYEDEGIL